MHFARFTKSNWGYSLKKFKKIDTYKYASINPGVRYVIYTVIATNAPQFILHIQVISPSTRSSKRGAKSSWGLKSMHCLKGPVSLSISVPFVCLLLIGRTTTKSSLFTQFPLLSFSIFGEIKEEADPD